MVAGPNPDTKMKIILYVRLEPDTVSYELYVQVLGWDLNLYLRKRDGNNEALSLANLPQSLI